MKNLAKIRLTQIAEKIRQIYTKESFLLACLTPTLMKHERIFTLHKFCICFSIIFFSFNLEAQTASDSLPMTDEPSDIFSQYPFLKASENNILQPESLGNYFSKLQKLEMKQEGQVHAIHIGDSHIQADFFSGRMRDLYAEDIRFPMNARGFAFPYKIAQTNNPYNYGVSYTGSWEGKRSVKSNLFSRWGLAGVTACTFSENFHFHH